MEHYGIISLIPALTVLIIAFKTRKAFEPMLIGSIVGYIIVAKTNFFTEWLNSALSVMVDPTIAWIILVCGLFGSLIAVLEKSGGALGFTNFALKYANTQKKSLILAWIMGLAIFIDDYLNALTVGTAMKKITDNHKIPREMLAYVINSTAAPVCILLPFSTWAVFFAGLLEKEGVTINGSGMTAYIHTIPFALYGWAAAILVPFVILGIIPKIGPMKKAWDRVKQTGQVFPPTADNKFLNTQESNTEVAASKEISNSEPQVSNFLIPIIVLIAVTILTGIDLLKGVLVALVTCLILYTVRKLMSFDDFMETCWRGLESMIMPLGIVVVSFIFKNVNDALGLTPFVIETIKPLMSAHLVAAISFASVACIAFCTGTFWGLAAIAVPIVIPLAQAMDVNVLLAAGAIFSGAAFGSHACFYADATVLTARSSEIPPMEHALTQIPYATIAACITFIGYVILGYIV